MFFKKSILFVFISVSLLSVSCDFFNSFSEDSNPVSQFYLNPNSLSVAAGFFETISIICKPESAQNNLNIDPAIII
jgi:hypothetical protein